MTGVAREILVALRETGYTINTENRANLIRTSIGHFCFAASPSTYVHFYATMKEQKVLIAPK
jgi:hypothetical protein